MEIKKNFCFEHFDQNYPFEYGNDRGGDKKLGPVLKIWEESNEYSVCIKGGNFFFFFITHELLTSQGRLFKTELAEYRGTKQYINITPLKTIHFPHDLFLIMIRN